MSTVLAREVAVVDETFVDPRRIVKYCEGKEYVLPEGLIEHIRKAEIGLRRYQREVNNLSLVQATTRRLIRLRKHVDQELFLGLMVHARFVLGIQRGQLFDLNKQLNSRQREELKSMTLAGVTGRGAAEGRVVRK